MQVFKGLDSFSSFDQTILTNGTFDGVHLGHQKILSSIVQEAKSKQIKSALVTFWPHPRFVLQKNNDFKLLTTVEERIELLEKSGLDILVIIPFSTDIAEMSADEYVQKVLVQKFNPKKIVIGYDHKFGKGRTGDIHFLEKKGVDYGFEVEEISRKDFEEITVSSTQIRNHLKEGKIKDANALLGSFFTLSGIVQKGDQIGREIGFPTANIREIENAKLIPSNGVYAVVVSLEGKSYTGMLNIGERPTVSDTKKKEVEVHIFNFNDNIYEKFISVKFIERIRSEKKFNSLEELKYQLSLDKEKVSKVLETHS